MPGEFDIIKTYFTRETRRADVSLGIGDDAAIISVPPGMQLVHALDTLVAGVHFPLDTSPEDIAYKALAVNLSDMAAMGAEPAWFTIGLTLPEASEPWIKAFASSLLDTAQQYHVELIGGDTTHGPLCMSIAMSGYIPAGKAILRSGARAGDQVFITGRLGEAAAALVSDDRQSNAYVHCLGRLNRPRPRLAEGMALRTIASSGIDISDGFLADLGHVLTASQVGARINVDDLPVSSVLQTLIGDKQQRQQLMLAGGDDYELCFTVAADKLAGLRQLEQQHSFSFYHVGEITEQPGLKCVDDQGREIIFQRTGYQHFS